MACVAWKVAGGGSSGVAQRRWHQRREPSSSMRTRPSTGLLKRPHLLQVCTIRVTRILCFLHARTQLHWVAARAWLVARGRAACMLAQRASSLAVARSHARPGLLSAEHHHWAYPHCWVAPTVQLAAHVTCPTDLQGSSLGSHCPGCGLPAWETRGLACPPDKTHRHHGPSTGHPTQHRSLWQPGVGCFLDKAGVSNYTAQHAPWQPAVQALYRRHRSCRGLCC